MYIKYDFDKEFCELLSDLEEKYGQEIFEIEGLGSNLDITEFSKKFFSKSIAADSSIDENANVSENCIITYKKEVSKPSNKLNSLYILWKLLRKDYNTKVANDIIEKQISGDIYIHDAHMIQMPYCFNYSCIDIVNKGLPMVSKIDSKPPKYLCSFKSQIEQFVTHASNSTLGATGLADLLLVMSYYVKNILKTHKDEHFKLASEEDCWSYVKATLVSLIYTLNQPMRGEQSAFTNVSIYDDYFIDESMNMYIFPDGSLPDKEVVKKLQDVFLTVMNEELSRTAYTFPVTTACFAIDDDNNIKDKDFLSFIAKHNLKYGFINIYMGKSSTLSSCCRLRSDRENEYMNTLGGSSSKIGSLGVVTINMPRLVKISKDETEFFDNLKDLIKITGRINNCRRKMIQRKVDEGFMPLYNYGFINIDNQYSTTGINGLYEAVIELGYDPLSKVGLEFYKNISETIAENVDDLQKQYKTPHNCEQIPGEGASIKIAKKDRLQGYNDKYELYSNQFIPLISDADLLDRIKIQGLLDDKFTGGSILHVNVNTELEYDKMVKLIELCAKKGVRYFAINLLINKCVDGHVTCGLIDKCTVCNKEIIDTFTRVVGFLVNTKNFAKGRRDYDLPERKWYKEI